MLIAPLGQIVMTAESLRIATTATTLPPRPTATVASLPIFHPVHRLVCRRHQSRSTQSRAIPASTTFTHTSKSVPPPRSPLPPLSPGAAYQPALIVAFTLDVSVSS